MTTIDDALELGRAEQGLAVVSTLRADASIQSSLVNAGPVAHPFSGTAVPAFVTYGRLKLANLRARPQLSLTFRSGWRWATVEGRATLLGPDDGDLEPEALRSLLRDIFTGAGGTHDDWDAYDRVMVEQRRTAVLIQPGRVYGN